MDVLQFALLGLGLGGSYVLLGQGIVLIYRGSGVLSFAQGAIAMLTAQVFYELREAGVATVLALPAALGAAAATGAVTQVVVLRRLRESSALIRLIATLGILTLLHGAGQVIWGNTVRPVQGILPEGTVDFGAGMIIGLDRLILILLSVLLTGALWFVYQRTRYGLATSAVSENQRAAESLGWSPDTISVINWVAGSVLAGIAGILLAPITGLSVTGLVLAVIPGLAAALVGAFSSFWLTLAGGLAIGVVQSEMARYVESPGWANSVPFLIIIALVTLRGRGLPLRGEFLERPVQVGSGRLRPWVLGPIAIISVLVVGTLSGDWNLAVTSSALLGMVALSLILVSGYAGQISLAQLAITGTGALAAANASHRWQWPFELSVIFGAVVALGVGMIVALPAMRCRGMNLAVVTIGLSLVIEQLVLGDPVLLAASEGGLMVQPPTLFGLDIDSITHPERYTAVVVLAFIVWAIAVANVRRGRSGRRLLALRNNERAATAAGVNVLVAKLYAFGLGAFIGGFAGAVAAFQFPSVDLTSYTTLGSITLLIQTVIGGIGYIGGALVGGIGSPAGVIQQALGHLDGSLIEYVTLISGFLVVITLLQHPDGVAHSMSRLRLPWRSVNPASRLRRTAKRPQLAGASAQLPSGPRSDLGRTLSISNLSVRFGAVQAVDDVSFQVRPGEVVGLIGPNGAGKTTLVDGVTGLVRSTGSVRVGDTDISRRSPRLRAAAGLGRTFQTVELFEDIAVIDNVQLPAESRGMSCYLLDLVYPRAGQLPRVARAAVADLGLEDELDRMPDELPAGRRSLVGIARMLAGEPAVVLLDEPAAGLDDEETRELGVLIRRLASEWGLAVLLIEHDVGLVASVSDRVIAVALGKVIAEGAPQHVLAHPAVVEAYLGRAAAPDRTEPSRQAAEREA